MRAGCCCCRLDGEWHHVAVTWNYEDGKVMLFLDGQQKTAFWKNAGGILDDKPAREGGVDPSLTPRTTRASTGSLVLGQVGCGMGETGQVVVWEWAGPC
jgi:hypothetical protein